MANSTHITKTKAIIGKNMANTDMSIEALVSMVDTIGLPNPAVETVEVIRDAPVALFIVAAVPPPAIIASAQVVIGFKSDMVDTITSVPAIIANGTAIASRKLSTTGI